MKYFGSLGDRDAIVSAFATDKVPPEDDILFAAYDGGGWDGYAMVVFETDGKLFEWEALAIRDCYGLDSDAKNALKALCASKVPQ